MSEVPRIRQCLYTGNKLYTSGVGSGTTVRRRVLLRRADRRAVQPGGGAGVRASHASLFCPQGSLLRVTVRPRWVAATARTWVLARRADRRAVQPGGGAGVRASHAVRSARSVPNASSLLPVYNLFGDRGALDTSFARALNCFCA